MRFVLKPASADHAASLALQGGPVSLSTLGIEEGAFGLQGVAHTRLSGNALIQLSQDARTVNGKGESTISDLTLESTRLSEQLVSFPRLHVAGSGLFAVDGTHYQLKEARLALGDTNFEGAFEMQRGTDFVSLNATAKAPLVSCQALVDSAPRGLLGAVERIEFDGTFSLDAGVEADTRHLSKMKVRWDFKNDCRAKRIPAELDPSRFHSVFSREVTGAGNYPMTQEFGPLSGNWVSYQQLSPFVEKALLVTEDGRFFRHNGFDDRAIESAIGDNARAGRFVRGASTISMQLAKNLYLSRDKTLARKFREAALTSLLEQTFTKQEILELYVNVIEFGPGIYGIERAAEYYFKSTPEELSAAQAFFLASILPAPSVEYFGADGTLSVRRHETIQRLLEIAHKRQSLTDEQVAFAQNEVLIFGRKNTTPEAVSAESAAGKQASGAQQNDQREVDPSQLDPFPLAPKEALPPPLPAPRPPASQPKKDAPFR
jgi:monofunctional biosynthetic peptidoglycan transglycosylase